MNHSFGEPQHGVEKLNEMRMLSALKDLAELLETHGARKWAEWFRGDLEDYLEARGTAQQDARQLGVVVHILTAFGGLSDFKDMVLTDDNGEGTAPGMAPGAGRANERLKSLAAQLWASTRGMQAAIMSRKENNP